MGARAACVRRPAPAPPVIDVEPEPEPVPEPPSPEEYRENFMARVEAAISYAVYEGPLLDGWAEDLALWARDVAERWTKLAERLEGAMTGPPR